jgi:hypothetical protein
MSGLQWDDASTATYTAEAAEVRIYAKVKVTVCLDDEGPMTPAFYWTVEQLDGTELDNGWSRSVVQARKDAVKAARSL